MLFHDKLEALNIKPITTEIILKELEEDPIMGKHLSSFTYYKNFGQITMFYTDSYLNETPFEILIERNNENELFWK